MQVERFEATGESKFATQTVELTQVLETMFSRIGAGEDILAQLEQISVLYQALDPAAPPMLRHYLERKSYTKALALLRTL